MSEQQLDLLPHAHLQGQPVPPDEAAALEARATRQDAAVLRLFRAGERLTPTEVHERLVGILGHRAPLLTSCRRSLTNLSTRGLLFHYKSDRRPGPRGARESTWGLA